MKQVEAALIMLAKSGDKAAAETLILQSEGLIAAIARRFHAECACTRQELLQAGRIGVLEAARQFCPEKGVSFSTYAFPWIVGEMRKAVALQKDEMGAATGLKKVWKEKQALQSKLGYEPTLDELAQACGMTSYALLALLEAGKQGLSLDEPLAAGEVDSLLDILPGGAEIKVESLSLKHAIGELEAQEERVIRLRYERELTQAQCARLLALSQAQVSRIERRALDRLKAILDA